MENSASREIQLEITASASIRTSTECRIYKVPYHLRKWNEEAYTPQVISIGPYHHSKKEFQPMEKHNERKGGNKARSGMENWHGDFNPGVGRQLASCEEQTQSFITKTGWEWYGLGEWPDWSNE